MLSISQTDQPSCADRIVPASRRNMLLVLSRLIGEKSTIDAHLVWLKNRALSGMTSEDDEIECSAALDRLAELEEAIANKREELKSFDQLSGA